MFCYDGQNNPIKSCTQFYVMVDTYWCMSVGDGPLRNVVAIANGKGEAR